MNTNANTGVDDREQWRARITRALQELRNEDSSAGRVRGREDRNEDAADSTKL
ncbi:MAG: hypothetical protein JWP87_2684 [Labilithrix sp.]|nr:hypothetical protein [Labilithrix sp.]